LKICFLKQKINKMENNNKNIIAVLLLLLASQMMLFIVLNFIPPSSKNVSFNKNFNAVPKENPLVLSGKWKLIK